MMEVFKVVICIVVVALFGLLQNVINLKKNRRARQFALPAIAFVLAIVANVIGYNSMDDVRTLFVKGEYVYNSDIALVNGVIFLALILIKLVLCPLCSFIGKEKNVVEPFVLSYYSYNEDYGEWFLLRKWTNFRKYFLAIVCTLALAVGTYLGLTWYLGSASTIWHYIFPCTILFVVNEMYNFINGQTKEEFEHSVLGAEADSRKVGGYYKVREVFEQTLPEPLLAAHTGFEYIGKYTPLSLIEELKISESRTDNVVADFFEIDERFKTADIDYVQATRQLMHRKNVLFYNPFYRDLEQYIVLPITNALLSGKKCLVISGRTSNCEDVKAWLEGCLAEYCHMKSLWCVADLSDKTPECDVGVLTFSQIYDRNVIYTNREFFSETDFVLLIEPSRMVNIGQVGLSIIAQETQRNKEKPVFCICDRNVEGLVDTMSHLLHDEITTVIAPPVPRCMYSGLSWDADGDFIRQQLFDKQTKYLGNGVELAAIAVKNQVPSVKWYCETKAPIKDIKWITGQHYSTICRYMNLPAQQKDLYEKIQFIPNLWSTARAKEQFAVVEDEFCNMFGMLRTFLSRGENQSFVNVLSENYLLRDYMRCNKQMFMSNPNSVPSIVPDYSKTERNTLIKLIILMSFRPVTEDEILEEFHLVGVESTDAGDVLSRMLKKYTFVNSDIFTVQTRRVDDDDAVLTTICTYTISNEVFDEYFAHTLKNAYYILEDEKTEFGYIDSKLFSHITQLVLPGQFVVYDGKYYLVKYISPQSGVVLRRAADLFDGRKYYRQIREYCLEDSEATVLSQKTVMDVEFTLVQTDIAVNTSSYLEMRDNHDLRTARVVDFSKDPTIKNYKRKYHNKTIMKVKLPDSDEKIRFTICLLLSEIFKSVFPDAWQYIGVITKTPEDIEGMLNYMVYSIKGDIDDDCIYIIEDSDIDLGLLEAVEKNWMKFMEVVADFLDWHYEKMREPESADPVPITARKKIEEATKQKQSLFARMAKRIAKLFGVQKEEEVKIEVEARKTAEDKPKEDSAQEIENNQEETSTENEFSLENEQKETKEVAIITDNASVEEFNLENSSETKGEYESTAVLDGVAIDTIKEQSQTLVDEDTESEENMDENPNHQISVIDGMDIFDVEGMPEVDDFLEDEFKRLGIVPLSKTRYQEKCYLKFGFDEIDGRLELDLLGKYLKVRGWSDNALTLARKREILLKNGSDISCVNTCDFCSLPINGVSYEVLNDGRVRCNDCSSTAITTVEEFRGLFYQVLDMLKIFYQIKYQVPIKVEMADARKIAAGAGLVFVPSTNVAPRALGYAQRKKGRYSLIIENGSPRLASIDTMVHELTHIWQYLNWSDDEVMKTYKMGKSSCTGIARDVVYEGMAVWSSIQYLYQIGESYYAAQQEAYSLSRNDVYGVGFRLYCEQYPLVKDSELIKYSPFSAFPPLEPEKVKRAVKEHFCTDDTCSC
ncbi:MAG: hypothetical protein IJA87_02390 [Clostridia bacterium]|nr:hypothetical protein [Clostridia bacterium]